MGTIEVRLEKLNNEGVVLKDETQHAFIAVDSGASGLRSIVLNPEGGFSLRDIYNVPSEIGEIPLSKDLTKYPKESNSLDDNAEYIIEKIEGKTQLFDKPQHIVARNLIRIVGTNPRTITNQGDKSRNKIFYLNIIRALTDQAFQRKAKGLKVKLGFILPPKEVYSDDETQAEQAKMEIEGTWKVSMPRYGLEFTIEIVETILRAENEAGVVYYTAVGKDAQEKSEKLKGKMLLSIDFGASTINVAVLRDQRVAHGVSDTIKMGGKNLVSKLHRRLSREFNLPVPQDAVSRAVETGILELGAESIPVGGILTEVKDQFADEVFVKLTEIVESNSMTFSEFFAIVFFGRGNLPTGKRPAEGEDLPQNYSPGMNQLLMRRLSEYSNAEGIVVPNSDVANIIGTAILCKKIWDI